MRKASFTLTLAALLVLLLSIAYTISNPGRACGSMEQTPDKPVWKTGAMPERQAHEGTAATVPH